VSRGAAPLILFGLSHHASPDRIPFHIAHGGKQMFVIECARKRPSLPQSPACTPGEVKVLGVAQVQWPEYRAECFGSLRYAYQVDVVGHEAIGQSP